MRKLMYEITTADGKTATTASYSKAYAPGVKVNKTFLVPVPEYTEEEIASLREHARKFWKKKFNKDI